MAATAAFFKTEYMGLPPDAPDSVAVLYLNAAKESLLNADVEEMQNNALYDLAVYSIAGFHYDNRGLTVSGTYKVGAVEAAQNMINSFVLQLRGAKDGVSP